MCRFEHDTMGVRSVMGAVMKRHGHDTMTLPMTAHDTISVIAQHAGNQREAETNDTMTLISSKWRDKGKTVWFLARERELSVKTGGRKDLAKTSVIASWRVKP